MTTNTPNMNLIVPTVGNESGPQYATDINSSLTIIDQHDHTAGSGVLITPAAININAQLPFNQNDAILLRTVRFAPQANPIAATYPDLGCLYEAGADLYYNDGNGNQIRITQSGSVSGSTGTITGLPSGTASAAYNSGSGSFVFQSATNTPANLLSASLVIAEQVANPNTITISSPSSLAASYSLTLPTALPPSRRFLTVDNSGNVSAPFYIDNSTLTVVTNQLKVSSVPVGIIVPNIINDNTNGTVTTTTSAQISNTVAAFSNSGNPVAVILQNDTSSGPSSLSDISAGGLRIKLFRDTTVIGQYDFRGPGIFGNTFYVVDLNTPIGAHAYSATITSLTGASVSAANYQLVVYEL